MYSWSIANNFVIDVYCRCLEILCQITLSSIANYFRSYSLLQFGIKSIGICTRHLYQIILQDLFLINKAQINFRFTLRHDMSNFKFCVPLSTIVFVLSPVLVARDGHNCYELRGDQNLLLRGESLKICEH